MSDENDTPAWPNPLRAFQQATEQATEQQQQLLQGMLGSGTNAMGSLGGQLGAMSQMATFKTRVQSGGRISIPDAEREALDIEEGDIVQTVVIPVKRNRDDD
ncbi:AbrB/MazE/SpoVT family DNA-binding domain-containing protein [Halorarius halobius]|uniref:AbrB/MazE/SpoVT family DNA-binding domain-containing protein n=1 Tax=Halorarius halobius TaxID=2962671 RepID=UPI0020CB6D78|nr:AbrB/MazE/SpoVT family DNA-binding domain-containing protein [Halorarius halobius]